MPCGTRGPRTPSSNDAASGEFVRPGSLGTVRTGGRLVDIEATPTIPRPPQGHPVHPPGRRLRRRTGARPRRWPTRCSRGTASSRTARRSTPTSRAGSASVRPPPRRPADPAGCVVRAGRHGGGGRGAAARDPAPAGPPERRARVRRAGVEPRPVGVRRRRPAARDRPAGRRPVDHPGSRLALPRPARHRAAVARAVRGAGAVDPRPRHPGDRPRTRSSAPRSTSRPRSTGTCRRTPRTASSSCRT